MNPYLTKKESRMVTIKKIVRALAYLVLLTIGLGIYVGIPYFFHANWLFWISWIPAVLVVFLLEDIICDIFK